MIEFDNGPVLRFQLTASEERSHRHLMESLGVRAEAARPSPQFPLGRARPGTGLRELATRTWRRSRARVLLVLAILIGAIAYQSLQTQDLERQLVREQKRVSGLAELLRKLEGQTLTRAELDALRDELSKGLIDTGERVRALEASSAAVSQIIARSSASVAFVQGSFGFEDPATKRPLRFAVTKNGSPIRAPDGRPVVTVEGSGPLVKVRFTGTAFVVNRDGVLLTNRHVAMPWEDEPLLPAIRELGLEPVMQRMQGYLSGASAPFDVTFLGASDTHDVAVVQGDGMHVRRHHCCCPGTRRRPATRRSCSASQRGFEPCWRAPATHSSRN